MWCDELNEIIGRAVLHGCSVLIPDLVTFCRVMLICDAVEV